MKRTQHTGAFLIVEGSTDARLFNAFVNVRQCRVVTAHSKDNAIQALSTLDQYGFPGVLAIVDADYQVLERQLPTQPNLLLTDAHDIDTVILRSPALEKVLAEYGSESKIGGLTSMAGKDVRQILLDGACHIGYLRWCALRLGLALRFEGLTFGAFTSLSTCVVDPPKLMRALRNRSQPMHMDEPRLREELARLTSGRHDAWHVCCGHDLVALLALGLRRAMGTNNAKDVTPEVIAKSLRLAYETRYFEATALYRALRAWEQANPGYLVLASSRECG